MTSDVLVEALNQLRGTGPEYEGFLANHGPMAAEALTRLGASEEVPAWVDGYRRRLADPPAVVSGIDPAHWRHHLGDGGRFGDWTRLRRQEAAQMPWRDLLHRWWPRLLPGMGASATHGVIRTAHAARSLLDTVADSDPLLVDELAQGLGSWAARYLALPVDPQLRGDRDAVTATAALPRLDVGVANDRPGIVGRFAVLGAVPTLGAALDRWQAPADPDLALDELIAAAARVLAARRDAPIAFCHAVTAPAAVRMVLPALPAPWHAGAMARSWQVVGAIVAAFASPREDGEAGALTDHDPAPLLHDLAPRAVAHGDEHVIKLTEAALREYGRTATPHCWSPRTASAAASDPRGSGDLDRLAGGDPQQLVVVGGEDGPRMAGRRPDLFVLSEGHVDEGLQRLDVADRSDPADDEAGGLADELRVGAVEALEAEAVGQPRGVHPVRPLVSTRTARRPRCWSGTDSSRTDRSGTDRSGTDRSGTEKTSEFAIAPTSTPSCAAAWAAVRAWSSRTVIVPTARRPQRASCTRTTPGCDATPCGATPCGGAAERCGAGVVEMAGA